ncbi:MAG: hypothetical protein ACREDR_13500 [Blastocatellia bacterium]
MTRVEEVMSEVRQLSREDRLRVLELLTRTLQEESRSENSGESSLAVLRGVLQSDDPPPPDAELADIYTSHLLEKHT